MQIPDLTWINATAAYIVAVGIILGALASFKKWLWPIIVDWVAFRPAIELKRLAFEAEWMKEHSEIPMFRLNNKLECVWTNRALQKLLDVRDGELDSTRWFNIIHDDDIETVKRKWREAIADKSPYHNRQRMIVGGNAILFRVTGDPFIHGGQVVEFMGTVKPLVQ